MRHYPDITARQSRAERIGRLFELHRQTRLQTPDICETLLLLPDVEQVIKLRALASLNRGPQAARRGSVG